MTERHDPMTDIPDPLGLRERVLYRDAATIVLDKPAGIAVHKGPKGGMVLEDGFDALRFDAPAAPQLAHRLDKETSGCLVLGRTAKSIAALGKLFAGRGVEKAYWAVVEGGPDGESGVIEAPLRKRDAQRGWWMVVDHGGGQPSSTAWKVLGRGGGFTWLELEPITGRTHQLRIHSAHMGFPILGDAIYGRAPRTGARLHLHARRIAFTLDGRRVSVEAPVPLHMTAALSLTGWRPAA